MGWEGRGGPWQAGKHLHVARGRWAGQLAQGAQPAAPYGLAVSLEATGWLADGMLPGGTPQAPKQATHTLRLATDT